MRKRIDFTAWGRGQWEAPAYAYVTEERDGPADAVATAIARKSGLQVVTMRSDGHGVTRGEIDSHHYVMTLGTLCPGGGYTPEAEVWFAIPVGQ